jgi:hypothetical protein
MVGGKGKRWNGERGRGDIPSPGDYSPPQAIKIREPNLKETASRSRKGNILL